jgi:hypothetical protein
MSDKFQEKSMAGKFQEKFFHLRKLLPAIDLSSNLSEKAKFAFNH